MFPGTKQEGASLIILVKKPTAAADISESRVKSEVVSAVSRYWSLRRGIVFSIFDDAFQRTALYRG